MVLSHCHKNLFTAKIKINRIHVNEKSKFTGYALKNILNPKGQEMGKTGNPLLKY